MPLPPFLQRFSRSAPATVQASLSASDIEQARTRARRRMVGMAVLVVVAVAVLSWLLETEPRSGATNIRIVSSAPSEATSVPAVAVLEPTPKPALQEVPKPVAHANKDARPAKLNDSLDEGEQVVVASASQATEPATTAAPSDASKPEAAKPVPAKPAPIKPAPVKPAAVKPTPPKPEPSKSVPAKPEAKPVKLPVVQAASKPTATARYVVQVGAFTEVAAAHATRMKVEALGLKTYTQVVATPAGKKIRVRLGPFTSEAEAQRALTTVRKAGVVGGILTM